MPITFVTLDIPDSERQPDKSEAFYISNDNYEHFNDGLTGHAALLPLQTPEGMTYEPWTDGHAVGFKCIRAAGYVVMVNGLPETDIRHDTEEDAADEQNNVDLQTDERSTIQHMPEEVSYIYLNPSSETDGTRSNVFVYMGDNGDPAKDAPLHFYDILGDRY